MPEKPPFIPTTNELFDAIAVLLIAFCSEIPAAAKARIRASAQQTIEALQATGDRRVPRIASALLGALDRPDRMP